MGLDQLTRRRQIMSLGKRNEYTWKRISTARLVSRFGWAIFVIPLLTSLSDLKLPARFQWFDDMSQAVPRKLVPLRVEKEFVASLPHVVVKAKMLYPVSDNHGVTCRACSHKSWVVGLSFEHTHVDSGIRCARASISSLGSESCVEIFLPQSCLPLDNIAQSGWHKFSVYKLFKPLHQAPRHSGSAN